MISISLHQCRHNLRFCRAKISVLAAFFFLASFILASIQAAHVDAQEGSITPESMREWTIVCASEATESEQYAATEFQALFQELSAIRLSIVDAVAQGRPAIFIGPDAVAASGNQQSLTAPGDEDLRIRVDRNAVYLDGGRPRGTLYAVYEFFEEWCGVRYLTHDHTYYPETGARTPISLGTRTHSPTFSFRWSYYGETHNYHALAARQHSNTITDDKALGGRTGFRLVGHNVAYLVPPATYGAEHPEYFALVDGKRKLHMHGGGPQLCMTNPEVLDIAVEAVKKQIKQNPTARNINVAHMDNGSYCQCENCAAVDAREESHAGATLTFVNAVAERIEPDHPDVLIGTYAYQYTRKPPKNIRARDNVMIQLCSIECCCYHAIDDPGCALNRDFCADMALWKTKAKNVFIWHYNTNFRGYFLPFPNLRSIGDSVAYFKENNGQGVFMQAAGNVLSAELSDLRNYVMSRCLWKPGRDSWDEAKTFCRLHYQEAAPAILDYLKYYHDLVEDAGTHPDCFSTESSLHITPESARTIFDYFQRALDLATSDVIRTRVEKASLCAYRAVLSASTMRLQYQDGICTPDLRGLAPDMLEQYALLCERYGVKMENEHTPLPVYLEAMRKLYAGMEAVLLENDTWRIVVLPESNAKIVDMTYKPTGRNISQAARGFDRFRHEEWVQQGEGPGPQNIVRFKVAQKNADAVTLIFNAEDGSTIERTISLKEDVVHFTTKLNAQAQRPYNFQVHPEYDAATHSDDPDVLSTYIKAPDWKQANAGWRDGKPSSAQNLAVHKAVAGGAFAFYNHVEQFGVEQRFAPAAYSSLDLFWSPARSQVNLALHTQSKTLAAGEHASHAYQVRYLTAPPIAP